MDKLIFVALIAFALFTTVGKILLLILAICYFCDPVVLNKIGEKLKSALEKFNKLWK